MSLQDAIADILASLPLPGTDYHLDWAMDYPGQQLAIDLYAGNGADLAAAISAVRAALAERLGIDARPSADIEAEMRLRASA